MTLWYIFHLKIELLKITTKTTLSFARIITRRIASHDHQSDDDDDDFDARKSSPTFVFFEKASKEWWYSLRSFS